MDENRVGFACEPGAGSGQPVDEIYDRVIRVMRELELDALLVTDSYNMRYIASYRGEGVILITNSARYVLTDSRYTEQVERECRGYECVDIGSCGYADSFARVLAGINDCEGAGSGRDTGAALSRGCHAVQSAGLRVGFEDESISYKEYTSFAGKLAGCELTPVGGRLNALREIKSDEEIEKLRAAESIGDAAFSHILGFLAPGVTEKEVALELEYFMKRNGAEGLSFDTIAASGRNSSMPHAIPTDRELADGDFLTMDFGCVYEGYCSDMTRTVAIGQASDRMRKVYDIVLDAQLAALSAVRPGVRCCDVDAVARRIIADAGYGNCFGHGLGHSVGLYIHENPRFSPKCSDVLQAGMVITVEPGIYLPGQFGVRIEDMICVTENGYINLAESDKRLIVV